MLLPSIVYGYKKYQLFHVAKSQKDDLYKLTGINSINYTIISSRLAAS